MLSLFWSLNLLVVYIKKWVYFIFKEINLVIVFFVVKFIYFKNMN